MTKGCHISGSPCILCSRLKLCDFKYEEKVLFVMKTLEGGGAEKVLVNILNHLDEAKYEITLLLLKYEGVYLSSLPSHIKVKYFAGA